MAMIELEGVSFPSFLESLPSNDRREILRTFTIKTLQKKSSIQASSCRFNSVGIVLSGKVRVMQALSSGKEIIYGDLHRGDLFGVLNAVCRVPIGICYVSLSRASVALASGAAFNKLMAEHPCICKAATESLANNLVAMSHRVFEFVALSMKHRLYGELLRQADLQAPNDSKLVGEPVGQLAIAPRPKHADLAARVGSHREAVTRELNRLEERSIITRRRGELVINNPEALRSAIDTALQV